MSDREELWIEKGGEIFIRGVRCTNCESVLFPPQPYGCEACGADGSFLESFEFLSQGTLHSFTTVYVHPKIETPYQVAEVQTEARQYVRARLDDPDPQVGKNVVGCIQIIDEDAQFVFVPASQSGG